MIIKLSISLPETMAKYARWRVRTGGYGSISEYFRELVRIDTRFERERVQQEKRLEAEAAAVRPNSTREDQLYSVRVSGKR